jgi:hypothetical protein
MTPTDRDENRWLLPSRFRASETTSQDRRLSSQRNRRRGDPGRQVRKDEPCSPRRAPCHVRRACEVRALVVHAELRRLNKNPDRRCRSCRGSRPQSAPWGRQGSVTDRAPPVCTPPDQRTFARDYTRGQAAYDAAIETAAGRARSYIAPEGHGSEPQRQVY